MDGLCTSNVTFQRLNPVQTLATGTCMYYMNCVTVQCVSVHTLLFSFGVVVAVAQHSHIKKKIDKKRVDVNSQKGRPERCETH